MRRKNFLFKFFNLVLNIVGLNIAFILAYLVRFEHYLFTNNLNENYLNLLIFLNLVAIILSLRDKVFAEFETINPYKVFKSILKDSITIIISLVVFIVALKGYDYSRQFHIIFSFFLLSVFFILRYFNFGVLYVYKIRKQLKKNIIILAINEQIPLIVNRILKQQETEINIQKIYSLDLKKYEKFQAFSIVPFDELVKDLSSEVNELIIFFSDKYKDKIEDILHKAENKGIRVRMVPSYLSIGVEELLLEYEYNLPLLRVRPEPLEDVNNYLLKRVFDIIISFFFIVLIYPFIYIIIGILIKIESKGPIIYRQARNGQSNNIFKVYKFRSMTFESNDNFKQATKNDPRVTKIGNIIRKTNIDELPQFLNVLRGDMSIVGPRPHPVELSEEYSDIISKYKVRHFCKPGITGWAQVNGFRGETQDSNQMLKRVNFDIWYIENWTFWLDIKIFFLTIWKLFVGDKNAY